jgi:rfaE bifunctional protein nucleotidyltransferase chain/domain/rfaE bifunctional protein kinase chain/domain
VPRPLRLLVVGDTLLDIDLHGAATRLCPDDPAPVLEGVREQTRPGGAGLTALLAARSGADVEVTLATPIAADADGAEVRRLLTDEVVVLPFPSAGTTAVKTRVRAGGRTLARLDRGGRSSGPAATLPVPVAALRAAVEACDVVLVSDYGGGITADPMVRALLDRAATQRPLVWDPHPRGATPVPGARLVTPNWAEAAAAAGVERRADPPKIGDVVAVARDLRELWAAQHVAVTIGGQGAVLDRGHHLPAPDVVVRDTCGAGDAFAAHVSLRLAAGVGTEKAVGDAVRAAAEHVSVGVDVLWSPVMAASGATALGAPSSSGGWSGGASSPCASSPGAWSPGASRPDATTPAASTGRWPSAAVGMAGALAVVQRCRRAGGRVVVTGGCFDLLHAGHVASLEAARTLGDCLVVALNSDTGVRRLKGEGRPVVPQGDRARLLAGLRCVDAVVVFDEATPELVLRALRPDVFAKGGDYTGVPLPEADVMAELGGVVALLPLLPGRSTTTVVQRLQAGRDTPVTV